MGFKDEVKEAIEEFDQGSRNKASTISKILGAKQRDENQKRRRNRRLKEDG